MKKISFILILVMSFYVQSCEKKESAKMLEQVEDWFILLDYRPGIYSLTAEKIQEFDMVILDPDSNIPISAVQDQVILIAYLSVGEAEIYRNYWKSIKDRPWIIAENPNWEGNYYVDVRDASWRKLIIDEVIPDIISKGFQGVMLDTLDTAEILETDHNATGAYKAMIQFIAEIHERYPDLLLISNNGFSILEEIAPYLSAMLVEDIHRMIDFDNNSYVAVSAEDRQYKINIIKPLMEQYSLPVFNIDYVEEGNSALRIECIKNSKNENFKPYTAEKMLSKIYEQE